jgi:hypothetical protein
MVWFDDIEGDFELIKWLRQQRAEGLKIYSMPFGGEKDATVYGNHTYIGGQEFFEYFDNNEVHRAPWTTHEDEIDHDAFDTFLSRL